MIAVMGASGNTGGEISRTLLAEGEHVRVLGRSPERLEELEAARGGSRARRRDRSAEYLTVAFAGADAVYTLMPYDVSHPDYHAQQHDLGSAVAEAIATAGVRRVVALSAVGADVADGDWSHRQPACPGEPASRTRGRRRAVSALGRVLRVVLRQP